MELELKTFVNERFSNVHHRQLVVISGAEIWCTNIVEQLINLLPEARKSHFSLLSCNTDLPNGNASPTTNNGQYRHHLGVEYDWVVYNCWRGVRANALAALSGTVKSNGLFILLCPEFPKWQQHRDAEMHLRVSYGLTEQVSGSRFIRHLTEEIESDEGCILINEKGLYGKQVTVAEILKTSNRNIEHQNKLIEKIKKVALGHRKRPLVISADRGRGKSAALGIAAAKLAANENKKIIVTAPQKSAVETLFKHAREHYNDIDEFVSFCAIDDLIINQPPCDLLMVDEAAAIPVHQLIKLTCRYSRIMFTTTVNGYEGSGRGFEIRFKRWLLQCRPEVRFETLRYPFRWFEQDCLEEFWWRALHLKPPGKHASIDTQQPVSLENLRFEEVGKDSLVSEKLRTNRIFSLLINAHYQTSPDDFVALLDAPEQKLFVAYQQFEDNSESIVGVLLANLEGRITEEKLSTQILRGQRRVQGHMLAQQLAFATCDKSFLEQSYLRIVRIAVHEHYRQKAIGSQLVAKLQNWGKANHINYLGSSFGANASLTSFWLKTRFAPVLLGFHRDKATAEFNVSVLKPVHETSKTASIKQCLQADLRNSLLFHLPDIYRELENEMVTLLLEETLKTDTQDIMHLDSNKRNLEWFCQSNRSLEHAGPLLVEVFNTPDFFKTISQSEQSLFVDYLLKRKTIKEIVKACNLEGQKAFVKAIKVTLSKILTGVQSN